MAAIVIISVLERTLRHAEVKQPAQGSTASKGQSRAGSPDLSASRPALKPHITLYCHKGNNSFPSISTFSAFLMASLRVCFSDSPLDML